MMKLKITFGLILLVVISCGSNREEMNLDESSTLAITGRIKDLEEKIKKLSETLDLRFNKVSETLDLRFNEVSQNYLTLANEISNMKVIPSGTIIAYAGNYTRELKEKGWLLCDGARLNVQEPKNADLFKAIQTLWGGDGKSYFNLPNLEGQFLRGFTANKNLDPGNNNRYKIINGKKINSINQIGSYQNSEVGRHNHGTDAERLSSIWNPGQIEEGHGGLDVHISAASVHYYGGENRPKNVYVHFLIKQ